MRGALGLGTDLEQVTTRNVGTLFRRLYAPPYMHRRLLQYSNRLNPRKQPRKRPKIDRSMTTNRLITAL